MMGGGSGQEASVLEGLIAFGRDPKAMAGRLEQLKAAQDAADERLAKAAEVEAANAKRVDELDDLGTSLDRRKAALDQREAEIANAEARLDARSAVLDGREAEIDRARAALAADRKTFDDGLKSARARHEAEAAALDERETALTTREAMVAGIQSDLMQRSEALDAREADFIARQEAVRQALAGVREP